MRKEDKEYLDAMVSAAVRGRPGPCCFCRLPSPIYHPHHLHSRRYMGTRFEKTNVQKICNRCHMKATHDPIWNEKRSRWLIGDQEYERLEAQAERVTKVNDPLPICVYWGFPPPPAGVRVKRPRRKKRKLWRPGRPGRKKT